MDLGPIIACRCKRGEAMQANVGLFDPLHCLVALLLAKTAAPRRPACARAVRAALAAIALLASQAHPAPAEERLAPTPKSVIYPGDIIRDDMLTDLPQGGARDGGGPYVEDRSMVVGKMARLTLLPGHAIPYASVSNRKLVANGAEVRLVYAEGGLVIVTSGAALQDGSIGDLVRVRNTDSGVTVSGAVQPDGSVKVGGG